MVTDLERHSDRWARKYVLRPTSCSFVSVKRAPVVWSTTRYWLIGVNLKSYWSFRLNLRVTDYALTALRLGTAKLDIDRWNQVIRLINSIGFRTNETKPLSLTEMAKETWLAYLDSDIQANTRATESVSHPKHLQDVIPLQIPIPWFPIIFTKNWYRVYFTEHHYLIPSPIRASTGQPVFSIT